MEDHIFIPQTIEECLAELDRLLSDKDKEYIKSIGKDSIFKLHFSLGSDIRNRWKLWRNEPLLKHVAEKRGFESVLADDVSDEIINEYYEYLCKR